MPLGIAGVPTAHVLGMGLQVGPRPEESIVEVEIEMMSLDVVEKKDAGHRSGHTLPKVSKTYCACRLTHCLNSSLNGCADPLIAALSFQAPGVSSLCGPPRPNLRCARASTAALMLG